MRRRTSGKSSNIGRRRAWRRSPRRRGKWQPCFTSAPRGNGPIARAASGDGSACVCAPCGPPAPPRVPSRSSGSPGAGSTRPRPGRRPSRSYVRRGTGDRYPRSALAGVAQPWELAIADALEDRFAEIRRLARADGLSPACEARMRGGREGRASNLVTASTNLFAGQSWSEPRQAISLGCLVPPQNPVRLGPCR
jgi:hypothetical protein